MEGVVKIIIAEDSELYRRTIVSDLMEFDMNVIAEASNGRELLIHLEKSVPDVILLDLEMPELDGNKTMAILSNAYPLAKVIILSSHTDQYLMEDYMLRGAKGYISKDEVSGNIEALARAIKRVHDGGIYRSVSPVKRQKITARQVEIINHFAEGKSKQETADKLKLTRNAVYKQEQSIKEKLGIKQGNLVRAIFALGLNFLGRRF